MENLGDSTNVVWKVKVMRRSIANPQLQSFSGFIWKSHKKADPLNCVLRHETFNSSPCKIFKMCICIMHLNISKVLPFSGSIFHYLTSDWIMTITSLNNFKIIIFSQDWIFPTNCENYLIIFCITFHLFSKFTILITYPINWNHFRLTFIYNFWPLFCIKT